MNEKILIDEQDGEGSRSEGVEVVGGAPLEPQAPFTRPAFTWGVFVAGAVVMFVLAYLVQ